MEQIGCPDHNHSKLCIFNVTHIQYSNHTEYHKAKVQLKQNISSHSLLYSHMQASTLGVLNKLKNIFLKSGMALVGYIVMTNPPLKTNRKLDSILKLLFESMTATKVGKKCRAKICERREAHRASNAHSILKGNFLS